MALKYVGWMENMTELRVGVLGDGVSKTVALDLTAAPFNMTFPKNFYPTGAWPLMMDAGEAAPQAVITVAQQTPTVTLTYAKAPPVPLPGRLSPRSHMTIYLSYG
jgi:hypothetical protein